MAVQVIATVAGKLGVEMDAEDELAAARKEREQREDERGRGDAFSDDSSSGSIDTATAQQAPANTDKQGDER